MQRLAQPLSSLHARVLALMVLLVGLALATVAVAARASTTTEFTRYVDANRQDMQYVAQQVAATTGERMVVTDMKGIVMLDSANELVGETLTPDKAVALGMTLPPPPVKVPDIAATKQSAIDVLFLRRGGAPPTDAGVWTAQAPMMAPGFMAGGREQDFLATVSQSLLLAVLVGGAAAVVVAALFTRGILRPIGALTAAARRMEGGDLSQRVRVTSRDEIGQLGLAFNAMADGLARTEQLRRNMVADVAHELRTPLTNLRGYLEAMRDGVIEVRRETIESLYDEALLLTHLVDDMQDLSLSDAGRLALHRESVDAATLVSSAALAAAPQASAHGISLRVEPVPPLPPVYVDPQRVGQVLRNLLSNALAYTPAGGTVAIRASAERDVVRIDVRDTGAGIPAEHLPNVFERFYRADPSRARATGGAGIGLALVKQFISAHGGEVAVESEVGQGSCFSFTLPVARETSVAA